ncbi:spore germination protein [Anaerobranca gottschalkii]|uniref:Spore germination protein n=1 Tax=Anaerobranca gottschalkii DSM 13577 TaxID=1120990 RepID=A0A1I0AM30_9FIRM|nr:spore germination protein [Anaerobranca gottschalkii]SES94924.1 spore germination protein [Anaerobranca gottschalkii DSM 13577]
MNIFKRFISKIDRRRTGNKITPNSNPGKPLYSSLDKNYNYLKNLFKDCEDIKFRKVKIGNTKLTAIVVFVDGMVNQESISSNVIRMLTKMVKEGEGISPQIVEEKLITTVDVKMAENFDDGVEGVLSGDAFLLVEGIGKGFLLETKSWESRNVTEPINEQGIRGPREGFTETLRINTSLIRRRIKNNDLKILHFKVGRISKTDVAVLYISNIASPEVVNEVKKRIDQIDIDAVLEASYIEEIIEERTLTLFPQILSTERPDRVVGHLLEGKVTVLVDGSPFALIMPVSLPQFFHTPDDYYNRYPFALLSRTVRFLAFFVASSLPSLYIIAVSFRYEVLPRDIIAQIAQTRTVLPFSPLAEVLLMEITVEFLREASLRLPAPLGQTVGIVGALVIGESAIRANLVSPILVIVIAIGLLGSFIIPNYTMATSLRVLRFIILLATGAFGGFGFILTWMMVFAHLCNIESFGEPYLEPIAPFKVSQHRDLIYRIPVRWLRRRPQVTAGSNVRRQLGVENDEE